MGSVLKITTVFAVAFLTAFFAFLICYFFFIYVPWLVDNGDHRKSLGYYEALRKGDGQAAIHSAKKNYAYEILGRGVTMRDSAHLIAQAYELDGQIEMALLWYAISERTGKNVNNHAFEISLAFHPSPAHGRLFFKQNKRAEAFKSYCVWGIYCLEKYDSVRELKRYADIPETGAYFERRSALEKIRDAIIMRRPYRERLTPFLDFEDFMVFMEEEYEKLGQPTEYAEGMKLFRTILSEIGEE